MSFDLAVRFETSAVTAEQAPANTSSSPRRNRARLRTVAVHREPTARHPEPPDSAGSADSTMPGGAVHSPPASRGDPVPVLSACDGSRVENPGAADIEAAVARLSAGNWFAVLDRGDHYVQVGFGEQAATRRGWFALEHRAGLPDRHFRAEVEDRSRIVRAFTGFASGDDGWRQEFDWQGMNS